jgi:fused signal recognition particle receptor
VEGLQILLVVAATLVIVSLLAVVPLVVGRRRRHDAGTVGTVDLDREPGVGDDAGQPPPPGREVADVDLPPDDAGVATVTEEVIAPRRRFRERLGRSRAALSRGLSGLLARGADDDEAWEELEEALLAADVGVATATELVERLRARARAERATGPALRELLRAELLEAVGSADRSLALDLLTDDQRPGIVLVVGVNGTGKTTSIGKLAWHLRQTLGLSVVVGAADTYRAAAVEQLERWAERAGVELVKGADGSDPGAVAFDAVARGRERGADVVIVDTAGRLHTQRDLMAELEKVRRVITKQMPDAPHETLMTVDATTGQNGVRQAKLFGEAVGVTGIVLTKLDGTAKGGIALAIANELGIPVKLIGIGEQLDDLRPFDADEFSRALLT